MFDDKSGKWLFPTCFDKEGIEVVVNGDRNAPDLKNNVIFRDCTMNDGQLTRNANGKLELGPLFVKSPDSPVCPCGVSIMLLHTFEKNLAFFKVKMNSRE